MQPIIQTVWINACCGTSGHYRRAFRSLCKAKGYAVAEERAAHPLRHDSIWKRLGLDPVDRPTVAIRRDDGSYSFCGPQMACQWVINKEAANVQG